jgi:hypothetical protein
MQNALQLRIQEVQNKRYQTAALRNFTIVLSFAASLLLTGTAMEALFDFSCTIRTLFAVLYLSCLSYALFRYVLQPLLRCNGILNREKEELTAKFIGDKFPRIKDRLVNMYQLSSRKKEFSAFSSPELLDAAVQMFLDEIQDVNFLQSVDRAVLIRVRRWFLCVIGGSFILFALFPHSLSGGLYRLAHFRTDFSPQPKYSFVIIPGSMEIIKGDTVHVTIRIVPAMPSFIQIPKELNLARRLEKQDKAEEILIQRSPSGTFQTVFEGVRATTEYYVRAGDVESMHDTLTVVDRPLARSFHLQLDYPAYTNLPERLQEEFAGDISAPAGTRITLTGTASKLLEKGFVGFSDSTASFFTVHRDKFSASFTVRKDNLYWLTLIDEEHLRNINPVQYRIQTIPDEFPSVVILEPGKNIDIAGDQTLVVRLQIKDDYGFSSLRIGYRLVKSRYEQAQEKYSYTGIQVPASGTIAEIPFTWNLSPLHLAPEDVVEYFAEVFDNDAVGGPKSGRSALFTLRLPSLDEVFADAGREQERSLDELQKTLEEAKKLKDDMESLNRDLKNNKDPDWQTQKKMGEMAKKYEEVQKKIEDSKSRLEHTTLTMEQQNVLSPATLEKYMELQQLFKTMDSAELRKALQAKSESMQNIDKQQFQQAMQLMSFREEQFRQTIERTIELLKRIQIEQKMDEITARVQALEQKQRELEEQTKSAQNNESLQKEPAQQQKDLAKQEQAMEHEAADLQKRMEQFFTEMPAKEMQQLLEEMKQENISGMMDQSASAMEQGNRGAALSPQQHAQKQLQSFHSQLSSLQKRMQQEQARTVLNALRRATNDLLELSKEEEELKTQAQSAPPGSLRLRENAQQQQRVSQDLQNVIAYLLDLSKKSFAVTPDMGRAIGEASAHMTNALRDLELRSGGSASQEQDRAKASLNNAAVQTQNALQAMMQGGQGGAGSLMQQLQRMAQQQMSINMETQKMNGEQRAQEAARLAQEQAAVQKSLEQLNAEAKQSSDGQRMLGDLGKISDEMKEVVRALEQNSVDRETIRKQDRILSRMLDASKSMHERDYEQRRKSESGTPTAGKQPADIDPELLNEKQRFREDLINALQQGYSRDYQELIKKYFELLEKSEKPLN